MLSKSNHHRSAELVRFPTILHGQGIMHQCVIFSGNHDAIRGTVLQITWISQDNYGDFI